MKELLLVFGLKELRGGAHTKLAEFGNGTANTTNLRIVFDDNDKFRYLMGTQ